MFGGNTYWWAGLAVFILFVGLNVAVFALRKKPELSYKIAYGIAFFLILYKTSEYIYWQAVGQHLKVPVEFSAVSYFLFGLTTVFRIKKLDALGVFCGFLAGMFYSVASWVSPDSFVNSGLEESIFLFVMAIINHHALYFGSIPMMANVRRFKIKESWWCILIGVAVMIGYSWLMHLFTPYTELYGKLIFIRVTDGSILNYLFPALNVTPLFTAIYLVVVSVVFAFLLLFFYSLNGYLAKKREERTGYNLSFPKKITFRK